MSDTVEVNADEMTEMLLTLDEYEVSFAEISAKVADLTAQVREAIARVDRIAERRAAAK